MFLVHNEHYCTFFKFYYKLILIRKLLRITKKNILVPEKCRQKMKSTLNNELIKINFGFVKCFPCFYYQFFILIRYVVF